MPDHEPAPSAQWRPERGAFERTFEFQDDFEAHDVADRLAFLAAKGGIRAVYTIGPRRLTVRTDDRDKEAPDEAETRFAVKADDYLRWRDNLVKDRNLRPARALIRLWLEAQDRLETALLHLRPDDLARPVRPGAENPLYEEAARHPISAGFGYLRWIRKSLGLPDTDHAFPPGKIKELNTLDDVFEAGRALRQDLEATVAEISDGAMCHSAYHSGWGEVFTVDQMLEHAVMHLHRHALQVEDYVAARK